MPLPDLCGLVWSITTMDIEAKKSLLGGGVEFTDDATNAIAGATVGVATVPPTIKPHFLNGNGVSVSL